MKHMRRVKHTNVIVSLVIGLLVLAPVPVFADESSSTNYKVDQTFFGSGGELENSSANYKAKTTVGELGVGETSSANYRAFAGFNTTDAPYIEFVVTADNIDLGYLDTASAKTANGTFSIRAWQSQGYVVVTASDPPVNSTGGQFLAPLVGGGATSPGTEQFGVNLVANTTPVNFGAAPVQTNSYAFGQAATGYNTANNFRYNKGDIVAQATQSSSVTNYTMSYLFNISPVTPAGSYTFNHILVATATY